MENNVQSQVKKTKPIFKKYEVVFAYLFGSQATGTNTKSSDYDIAVMLPDKFNSNKRFKIRLKLMTELSCVLKTENIDVIILNDIRDIIFKFTIVKEGKTIYEKNHVKRVMFEFNVMTNYYDFSPFIDEYNKAYLKRELKSKNAT